jgi:hypothetical protein
MEPGGRRAEYCGSCERACRRSRRLSRAKFEGVVIKIRGGRVCCPKAGLERSWKISSMRVCVFPVYHQYFFSLVYNRLTPGGPCIQATV